MKIHYTSDVTKMAGLSPEEKESVLPVVEKFAFRTNSYYDALINWDDPADPLRRLIIPSVEELSDWGKLDASSEQLYQPVAGIEHKYRSTVLLLCNDVCAAYCRFCFRKRLFQPDNAEVVKDISAGAAYIAAHPEVNNVLLTGGDPLVISTARLRHIFESLVAIPHVKNIRIGTKVPAFNPHRVLEDPQLPEMLSGFMPRVQVYIMAHFTHPRELTPEAIRCIRLLRDAGATVVNQTPIINGVNDNSAVLRELLEQLSFLGIQPYYVFACRPTEGNKAFAVPVETAFCIYQDALRHCSGLAKTARFIMSHRQGKVEVVGLTPDCLVLRNHSLVADARNGELAFYKRNPDAYWLDDFELLPSMPSTQKLFI